MAIGNSNTPPPGLMQPTTTSYTPGSGNPRASAIASNANMNSKQASLSAIGGKRRRRKRHKGGAAGVAVPQMQMPYTPTGGPGTNPNDQISGLSSTGMQSAAWKVNDNQASKMGGSRKKRKGGSNLNWGCLSGGFSQSKGSKRRRTRRRTRTTKRRRTRRRHR
jgi:hypothetical protein